MRITTYARFIWDGSQYVETESEGFEYNGLFALCMDDDEDDGWGDDWGQESPGEENWGYGGSDNPWGDSGGDSGLTQQQINEYNVLNPAVNVPATPSPEVYAGSVYRNSLDEANLPSGWRVAWNAIRTALSAPLGIGDAIINLTDYFRLSGQAKTAALNLAAQKSGLTVGQVQSALAGMANAAAGGNLTHSEQQQLKLGEISPELQAKVDSYGNELTNALSDPTTPTVGPGNEPTQDTVPGGLIPDTGAPPQPTEPTAPGTAPGTPGQGSTLEPWISGGTQAQNALMDLINAGPGDYTQSPGYDFRFQEGLNALLRKQAASGRLNSGETDMATIQYGQNFAANDYDNFLQRYYESLNPLFQASGLGQNSVVAQGNWDQNLAAQNASIAQQNNLASNQYSQQQSQNWLDLGMSWLTGGLGDLFGGNNNAASQYQSSYQSPQVPQVEPWQNWLNT